MFDLISAGLRIPPALARGHRAQPAYDADGYRFLRLSLDKAGKALLSVRDWEGRRLSEFVDEPIGGLKLVQDFVCGVGQQLIERQVTSAAPSYELDIRTASGFQNRLTGLQRDAAQQLHVPESALSPGETNVLRLRAEGEPGTGYSVPVSLLYDPSVTPSSPNQIRALGVSRNGTDLVLRWALLTENGKQTRVSFRRADTGATYVLTPQALASSIKSYTLSSQALASPCGDFLLSQVLQSNETGPTPPLRNPSSQSGTQGTEIDPCDDPPPDPAPGPRFTNAYHHRDHLGTLRNVTGDGGYLAAAYDWYPYGTRMRTGVAGSALDSRRVFTGHERDLATGLDYMMARYYSSPGGTFLSVDPGEDTDLDDPQSWNAYSYVRRDPLGGNDPDGRFGNLLVGFVVGAAVEAGSQVVAGMSEGKGLIDSVKGIEGNKVLLSAAVGGVTSGVSAIRAIGLAGRLAVEAAGNVAEGALHAQVDDASYGSAEVVDDAIVGAVAGVVGEGTERLTHAVAQQTDAAKSLAHDAKRLENIADKGRPRAAQELRAQQAKEKAASYGSKLASVTGAAASNLTSEAAGNKKKQP